MNLVDGGLATFPDHPGLVAAESVHQAVEPFIGHDGQVCRGELGIDAADPAAIDEGDLGTGCLRR